MVRPFHVTRKAINQKGINTNNYLPGKWEHATSVTEDVWGFNSFRNECVLRHLNRIYILQLLKEQRPTIYNCTKG